MTTKDLVSNPLDANARGFFLFTLDDVREI